MKKAVSLLLAALLLIALAACAGGQEPGTSGGGPSAVPDGQTAAPDGGGGTGDAPDTDAPDGSGDGQESQPAAPEEDEPKTGGKVLVAVFSATGTTRGVAEKIAALTGADIADIVPAQPYTPEDLNYSDRSTRATAEQNDPDARPELAGDISLEGYSTVFLGYPIWWGQAPRIISTFVERHDFTGITVIPFCTSGSSDIGQSDDALAELAGTGNWLQGRRFSGGVSEDELLAWIGETEAMNVEKVLHLYINDTEVAAEWEDNESVSALIDMVSSSTLTVQMSMYGDFEQVGSLGTRLPRDDSQTTAQAGDIVLYSGDQLVIFYGSNSWAYTRLGRITDRSPAELKDLLGGGDVTVTLSFE